jgi:uncharacterized protein
MYAAAHLPGLSPELRPRWNALVQRLGASGSVVVAFSGGVDSSLLATAAWHALGDRMVAAMVRTPVESSTDVDWALAVAAEVGFPLRMIDHDQLANLDFTANPPDRCYLCKRTFLRLLGELAMAQGYAAVVEGSTVDDLRDYRPGRRAVAEAGVGSPLLELRFTKREVRAFARSVGLPNWDRPSEPCLATRFPYGSPITSDGLRQIAQGERYLRELGFSTVRVRHRGQIAMIEVSPDDIDALASHHGQIAAFFRWLGFACVAADLAGYRPGSLNELLPADARTPGVNA